MDEWPSLERTPEYRRQLEELIKRGDAGAAEAQQAEPKSDDPEQSRRFEAMARELGADETLDAFEAGFAKVARHKPEGLKEGE